MSEIRLWFSTAAEAISLCQPHTVQAIVTTKNSATSYVLETVGRLAVDMMLTSAGAGTATVSTIDTGTLTITTSAWTGTEPLAAEAVTWTTAAPAHISDILNNIRPPTNGAIAGIAPQVYFGGPGATVADWNNGLNRGTLSAWGLGGGVT